jgi:hypothetical protein
MGVVPSAVAALDASRGVVAVVIAGMAFFLSLSRPPENEVTP